MRRYEGYYRLASYSRSLIIHITGILCLLGQVVIPLSLQRRVESLLQEHLDRTILNSKKTGQTSNEMESRNPAENVEKAEHADPFLDASVMEKVLQRRSLRLRNMQRTWQVCISFDVTSLASTLSFDYLFADLYDQLRR